MPKKRSKNHHQWRISAVERDQSKFEVDQDKARKALSELDQQIESLSTKQPNSPKIKGLFSSFMKLFLLYIITVLIYLQLIVVCCVKKNITT